MTEKKNRGMKLSNFNKRTPITLKRIADTCLYSLPLWQLAVTQAPFGDTTKLWLVFGITSVVLIVKTVTKLFTDEEL